MKKLLLLPFVSLLLLFGCKKDDPTKNAKLPEATQEGKNTVGFTMEGGEVWVPYYECGLSGDPCGKFSARVSYPFAGAEGVDLKFSRRLNKERHSILSIYSKTSATITTTGEKIDSLSFSYLSENWLNEGGTYNSPQLGSRFTVTKFDKANQIISGEFHLILRNQAGKTVTLSNGRFDFKFNACACDN